MTLEQRGELEALLEEGRVIFDCDMSSHTAIEVGGPAEAFIIVKDISELKIVMGWASEKNIDYSIIGTGSKTVIRDGGARGVLIRPEDGFDSINVQNDSGEEVYVKVGASTGVRKFVGWCVEKGYAGSERLLEARGTIGGCVMTNVMMCDGYIADAIDEVTVVNKEMKELTLKGKSIRFEDSRLKIPRTACLVRTVLKLKRGDVSDIAKRIDKIERKISEIEAGGTKYIARVFQDHGRMTASDMIYGAGLKGVRVGKARLSSADANIIVNEGGARSKDIIILISLVKDRVKQGTGFALEAAISILGDK